MSKPIHGYWDIRGLTEPIRYIHHYKNVDFEDLKYDVHNRDTWFQVKNTLGLDFPNLPYYIDGDVKLTQSITILRYLATKYDLEGKTKEQKLRAALAEQQFIDYRTELIRLFYNDDFAKLRADFEKAVPDKLKLVANFLGQRNFFAGDELTYVDFLAYETLDFYEYLIPKVLDAFPNLRAFQERIQKIPSIKKYMESSSFKRWPIFSPAATFGGAGPEPKRN